MLFCFLQKEKYLKLKAERELLERDANLVTTSGQGQIIVTQKDDRWKSSQYLVNPAKEAEQLPVPKRSLMDSISSIQRCLIVGASNAGKTNLLRHIVDSKEGHIVIIDPHASPAKWPIKDNVTVVGSGRDYPQIGEALDDLVRLMTKRYDEIGKGLVVEGSHEKRTIIIDEWRAIVNNCPGSKDAIKALLTESRKAAFSIFVATHSERVKALGIEGEGDLKENFTLIKLELVNGSRKGYLDGQEVILPGVYQSKTEDQVFRELVQSGISRREASKTAYGKSYAGAIVDRGKRALGEL